MRHLGLFSVAFLVTAAPIALAQGYSQTQGDQPGQTVIVPGTPSSVTSTTTTTVSPESGPIDSQGSGAIPSLPLSVQQSGDVSYLTGGIGDEELAELKSVEKDYNTHIMMSAASGEYVSEVSLRIMNGKDNSLVSIDNAGPYFYAKLKPGSYTVEATSKQGEVKKFRLTVPAKAGVKEHIVFKG